MSREIRFRVWDEWRKTMFYPGITKSVDGNDVYVAIYDKGIKWGLYDGWLGNRLVSGEYSIAIMQYTGLKDCIGQEIYEGDILESLVHKQWKKQVVFKNGCFRVANSKGSSATRHNQLYAQKVFAVYMFVVGNIYESHELLK